MLKQDQSVNQNVTGDHNKVAGRDFHDHSQTIIKKESKGHFFENISTGGGNLSVGDIVGGNKITQIFQGQQGLKVEEIAKLLNKGSYFFYEGITGPDGRFEHLEYSEHLLANVTVGEETEAVVSLMDHLQETERNTFLTGEGGMGKTVSLLWAWKQLIGHGKEKEDSSGKKKGKNRAGKNIIPIYIALNQYNRVSPLIRENFITQYIAEYYLGRPRLDSESEQNLRKWLSGENNGSIKGKEAGLEDVLLILDGLDEITTDITPLLIDLNEKWAPLANKGHLRMIVSSRFESNHPFTESFEKLEVIPLSEEQVKAYLFLEDDKKEEKFNAINEDLKDLLTIPMMLRLYAGLQNEQLADMPNTLRPINSTAELIWDYLEIQLHKFEKESQGEELAELRTRCHFTIHYVLPFIAYHMEKAQVQEITEKELEQIVRVAFNRFSEPDFFKEFSFRSHIKRYRMGIQYLQIGELSLVKEIGRFERLAQDLAKALFPVAKEGWVLRFTHQSFQEYFAARHVLNEINASLEKGEIPSVLRDQVLPENLQKTLGELAGEHYNKPEFANPKLKWEDYRQKTSLGHVVDLCRGIFEKEKIGHCVWNILHIWKKLRGSFAGVDLSDLHLSGFNFNGIDCRRVVVPGDKGYAIDSKWDESYLAPKQLFSEGHESEVNVVRLSPDGQILASASRSGHVKLWKLSTLEHFHDLGGIHRHNDEVGTVAFSPDGQKIASGGLDNKIIEWSVETGQALKVLRGHKTGILQIEYHPDGATIMALYDDGKMGEWSTRDGQCRSWFYPDGKQAQCFRYIKGGNAILVGGKNQALIEISTLTKIKTRVYPHKNVVALALSPDSRFFVAVSLEGTLGSMEWIIKEWKIDFDKEQKVFHFVNPPKNNPQFYSADVAYSPSGEYLLVAGLDDYIYEWALKDPQGARQHSVTQVFKGHVRRASSIVYLKDENYFFSGSFDGSIKKWSTATGQVEHAFSPHLIPYNAICKMPGSPFVLACSENGDIQGLDSDTLAFKYKLQASSPPYAIGYYETDRGETDRIVTAGEDGLIQIWDLRGKLKWAFEEHQATVTSLAINNKAGIVASGDMNGRLNLWSLKERKQIRSYRTRTVRKSITQVAIMVDENRFFVIVSEVNGRLFVWDADLEEDKPVAEFDHGDGVFTMDVLANYLLSGGMDGKLKEWNIDTREERLIIDVSDTEEYFTYAAYHKDLNKIMAGTNKSLIEITLNRDTNEINIRKFIGHTDYIIDLSFDDEGKYLYSTSQDLTLKKWNMENTKLEKSIMNYTGLKVEGLDLTKVQWIEPLTDNEFEMLLHYGAVLYTKEQEEIYEDR